MSWDPVDIALTQVGVKEATGHNDGDVVQYKMADDGLPWCAEFVMYCYRVSDFHAIEDNRKEMWTLRAVSQMIEEMKSDGVFYTTGRPQRNDLIFYTRKGGSGFHVGLVAVADDDYIYTVEGNFQNQVMERKVPRDLDIIAGFASPWKTPSTST